MTVPLLLRLSDPQKKTTVIFKEPRYFKLLARGKSDKELQREYALLHLHEALYKMGLNIGHPDATITAQFVQFLSSEKLRHGLRDPILLQPMDQDIFLFNFGNYLDSHSASDPLLTSWKLLYQFLGGINTAELISHSEGSFNQMVKSRNLAIEAQAIPNEMALVFFSYFIFQQSKISDWQKIFKIVDKNRSTLHRFCQDILPTELELSKITVQGKSNPSQRKLGRMNADDQTMWFYYYLATKSSKQCRKMGF